MRASVGIGMHSTPHAQHPFSPKHDTASDTSNIPIWHSSIILLMTPSDRACVRSTSVAYSYGCGGGTVLHIRRKCSLKEFRAPMRSQQCCSAARHRPQSSITSAAAAVRVNRGARRQLTTTLCSEYAMLELGRNASKVGNDTGAHIDSHSCIWLLAEMKHHGLRLIYELCANARI